MLNAQNIILQKKAIRKAESQEAFQRLQEDMQIKKIEKKAQLKALLLDEQFHHLVKKEENQRLEEIM